MQDNKLEKKKRNNRKTHKTFRWLHKQLQRQIKNKFYF